MNQSKFREANEQLEQSARKLVEPGDDPVPFLCECPREACTEVVLLTFAEYAFVRDGSARGVEVPGHEDETVERIIRRTDRFVVSEKFGEAADVVSELDPRDD